jgi:uncharacterized protein (DUF1778 family)
MHATARAYLTQPANERFETRIPVVLKRHAETVAKAKGESLSEYVLEVLAEKVAADIVAAQELRFTPLEQAELLRVLAAPPAVTAALTQKMAEAESLWGAAEVVSEPPAAA